MLDGGVAPNGQRVLEQGPVETMLTNQIPEEFPTLAKSKISGGGWVPSWAIQRNPKGYADCATGYGLGF